MVNQPTNQISFLLANAIYLKALYIRHRCHILFCGEDSPALQHLWLQWSCSLSRADTITITRHPDVTDGRHGTTSKFCTALISVFYISGTKKKKMALFSSLNVYILPLAASFTSTFFWQKPDLRPTG